jgi:hypothetical protein
MLQGPMVSPPRTEHPTRCQTCMGPLLVTTLHLGSIPQHRAMGTLSKMGPTARTVQPHRQTIHLYRMQSHHRLCHPLRHRPCLGLQHRRLHQQLGVGQDQRVASLSMSAL